MKIILTLIFFLFASQQFPALSSASVLSSWEDQDAYKPEPVLFLHGFAGGAAKDWNTISNYLAPIFSKYTRVGSGEYSGTYYLERVSFNDPNGSVDTPEGGGDGWADIVNKRVQQLREIYKFKNTPLKFNFVCHSMGGLAAREYATNDKYINSYANISKIITIATPHAGSPLATVKFKQNVLKVNQYYWEVPYYEKSKVIFESHEIGLLANLAQGPGKVKLQGEAIKDLSIGSEFLTRLNSRTPDPSITKFIIYGHVKSIYNTWFFGHFYPNDDECGDEVVPIDSQKGKDIMTHYPVWSTWVWKTDNDKMADVRLDHSQELGSTDTAEKVFAFLDSAVPEFEITNPNPEQITEIHTNSLQIKGKVYKEYLPADCKLIINVWRQDGWALTNQIGSLKPSNLWQPGNPDSPVAEIDQGIYFPGNGTYTVSCQIINPAGLRSEIKYFMVKVVITSTNIVVHAHNPEGKEIASILGMDSFTAGRNCVEIYDNNILIGGGATNAQTHNKPINLTSGDHQIKVKFNGMTKEQVFNLEPNTTKILTFTFERAQSHDYKEFWHLAPAGTLSGSGSGSGYIGDNTGRDLLDIGNIPGLHINLQVWGGALEYQVSGSATITVSEHAISASAEQFGTCRQYYWYEWRDLPNCCGGARIGAGATVIKYINIPDSLPLGFDNWFLQGTDPNRDYAYAVPKKGVNSEEYIGGGVNTCTYQQDTYQPEPDAVISSVPYDLAGSGV
ncbi:MAG: alpha/beta hydrolase [Candidatus Omnitrophota bacterium]|nr:alpha/beta hydrolase [Candidatus Omnitrophota bacterium]